MKVAALRGWPAVRCMRMKKILRVACRIKHLPAERLIECRYDGRNVVGRSVLAPLERGLRDDLAAGGVDEPDDDRHPDLGGPISRIVHGLEVTNFSLEHEVRPQPG